MERTNITVTETFRTVVLLVISIALFSVIYLSVLTIYPSPTSPSVNFICSVDEKNNNIIIEHRGGKKLDLDTEISITIADVNDKFSVGDYLDNDSKNNGVWNLGEKLVYPADNITNNRISISVVDIHSKSVNMRLGFQAGEQQI